MDEAERAEYRESIAAEIQDWAPDADPDDVWWPLIERVPDWFDGLVSLAGDDALNGQQRRVVRRVIKYLISPLDLRPEFIYGADGYREDLALIAWCVAKLSGELGSERLSQHNLEPESSYWHEVEARAEADLGEDLCAHLKSLLTADAVAGDEDLGWTAVGKDMLVAPPPEPVHGEHRIVFAGPGTGKTWRIERELERLLLEEGVEPAHILVTTFTNKAADELRLRIHQRLRESDIGNPDVCMQHLSIGTIHGFCMNLISRFHHHALFLKGTFSPMVPTARMLFLFRHGRALHLHPIYQDWKAARKAEARWAPVDLFHFYEYAGEVYDFLSEDVLRNAEPGLRHHYLRLIRDGGAHSVDERIIATYPDYWQLVQAEGYLDHAMTLAYAEALLDDPQVRSHVHATYSHVLVDEYQDTNPIQDRIFRALVGKSANLFVVGDDDQSIYAFRGADVRNATEFARRWPGASQEKLEENRRSTKALVHAAATQLIPRNRLRVAKNLHTNNPEGVPPWRLTAAGAELPRRLAGLLGQMKQAGAMNNWRDVAILFRGISKRVPSYRAALQDAKIPVVIDGDRHFLKRPVVKAFMEILKFIAANELNVTSRTRKHRDYFYAVGIDDKAAQDEMVAAWHQRLHAGEYDTLLDVFYSIMRDSGALQAEAILADMGHLSSFIAEAEDQLTSPDVGKRLSWFNSYADTAAGALEGPGEDDEDAVHIMTIHKSKGLEFAAVVIADVMEGTLPAGFPEDLRTRLRRELAGIEPHLDPVEEERRVLYVGMTRAKDYLILTTAPGQESPFLAEFGQVEAPAVIPQWAHASRRPAREPPLHAHHSAIYNFYFCPRRYLLENRYGFAGRVIAPLRAGQSLHRALEIYHRLDRDNEHITPERRERILERTWVRPRGKREAVKEWQELIDVFNTYANRWERDKADRHLKTLEVERPFYTAQGRGVLTGRIDMVRERDGRVEIVEFKYHKNPMLPDYPTRQLEHYSLAYPNEDIGLVVHYLKDDKQEDIARRDPDPIRAELDGVFRQIMDREFDPTPHRRTCGLCPARFACNASAA